MIIGISLNENLVSAGGSASSGKSPRMAFTFRWASFIETSTSAPDINVTVTIERLSYDLESIFLIFSNEATASSIFLVTVFSISLGEKNQEKAGLFMGNALTLTTVFGILIILLPEFSLCLFFIFAGKNRYWGLFCIR